MNECSSEYCNNWAIREALLFPPDLQCNDLQIRTCATTLAKCATHRGICITDGTFETRDTSGYINRKHIAYKQSESILVAISGAFIVFSMGLQTNYEHKLSKWHRTRGYKK